MHKQQTGRSPFATIAGGFTLVELLVVVAIIALLLGILLPALGKAREVARSTVCMANLKSVGQGFVTYSTEYRGYLPGPNTSGYRWLKPGRPPSSDGDPQLPITPYDWMSPVFGDSLGLSEQRNERLVQLFNHEFACPANDHRYDYIHPNGSGWPDAKEIRYNSYSAPLTLHSYQDSEHAEQSGQPFGQTLGFVDTDAVNLRPANHRFRVDTAGQASLKIAAADGARYIDGQGRISFNADTGSQFGSNFMNRSATLNVFFANNGNPYKLKNKGSLELHEHAKRFTYRHPGSSINASFLDGHAENLSNEESRSIEFWYPSGSVVNDPSLIGDPDVGRGDIVP